MIAFDLCFQGGDGGVESGELTLETVTPEEQHFKLSLLMLLTPVGRAARSAEGRQHGGVPSPLHPVEPIGLVRAGLASRMVTINVGACVGWLTTNAPSNPCHVSGVSTHPTPGPGKRLMGNP